MLDRISKVRDICRAVLNKEKAEPLLKRRKNELEFLPASIEIMESPPSPVARTMALILVAIVPIVLLWAWLSLVETEAIAEGVVIPEGKVKTIQALEIGKVKAIHVRDGQRVKAGDLLLTIDPTATEVDVRQVEEELATARQNSNRLELLLTALEGQHKPGYSLLESTFKDTKVSTIRRQNHILQHEYQHYQQAMEQLKQTRLQRRANIEAVKGTITKLNKVESIHTDMEQSVHQLYQKGHASKIEWLKAKEQRIETEQQLIIEQEKLKETMASLAAANSDLNSFRENFFKEHRKELKEEVQKAEVAELILRKAKERDQNFYLRAPVSGTVQQLIITTIGGVVEPAQALLKIVPEDSVLEVEASVLNKDIGFIQVGQKVDIKVESFPYTYFGQLEGAVVSVSKDAAVGENGQLTYPIRVSLKENQLSVHGQKKSIQAGMTVSAEINIGNRSVLDFFLSPLRKYKDESLNDR
ncbi:hypothetical protein EOPP23_17340 [Endozoicomonas sp. OPT23]|uniref:HlyD family type I secretion periplasmic adaptor subunit n=1 Tax=Endozoicomonas sp. OPT23 TaxID=2072845 RepID=UPI00129A4DCD|nr:HlyD family type I secretion periplasmic adaptor subunit [Endozoicomonas sp. OPT23]MRI34749.1 hypothetical protein [Endozoicomonas sp. OPT23]